MKVLVLVRPALSVAVTVIVFVSTVAEFGTLFGFVVSGLFNFIVFVVSSKFNQDGKSDTVIPPVVFKPLPSSFADITIGAKSSPLVKVLLSISVIVGSCSSPTTL